MRFAALAALLLAAALVPAFVASAYALHLFILLFLTVVLGASWNVIGGFGGQYSVGHAAYYGVGAYATMILLHRALPVWVAVAAGVAFSVAVALVIGSICFRLRGPYFVLASIAVAEILRLTALNWKALTNGAERILGGLDIAGKVPYYYAGLSLAALSVASNWLVQRSKLGLYLMSIREDQDAAHSLGIPITRTKNLGLMISAAFTALAGAFYALYTGFIDPAGVLGIDISVQIVLVCIIGGIGTVAGPVLGAALMVLLAEGLRASLSQAHVLVYGVLVVVVILFMPDGLLGFARGQLARRRARAAA